MKQKILLIEDEEDIASIIKLQADISGFDLIIESNGLSGLLSVEKTIPDLIILDLMLPSLSGIEICYQFKKNPDTREIPIIILSAKSEEKDIILGLELGADDYVCKPFSPKILFSRIRAVLRRRIQLKQSDTSFVFGPYSLMTDSHKLLKNKTEIPVTLSEFNILHRFLYYQGKVLTRNQLLNHIQDEGEDLIDRNIDVHIAAIRKKLGPDFNWIETIRGIGYRFKEIEDFI